MKKFYNPGAGSEMCMKKSIINSWPDVYFGGDRRLTHS